MCVGGAHFPGLPKRVEPVRQRHLRIATAAAVERVCVSDTTGRAPEGHLLDFSAYLNMALAVDGVLDPGKANPVNAAYL